MINREALMVGDWYDGFVWRSGKQKGTATMRWMDFGFTDGLEGRAMALHDPEKVRKFKTFEPNVVSVGEPAG